VETYLWIEEQTIGTPWEGLDTLVEILVLRNFRKFAAVLLLDVLLMEFMLSLNIVDPSSTKNHWTSNEWK
jgi:hypothetical protein